MAKTEEAHRGVEAEDIQPHAVSAGAGNDGRGRLRRRHVSVNKQQIFVKNLEGKTLTVDADLSGTTDDVMDNIKEKDDQLPDSEVLKTEFYFKVGKKVLDNKSPLSELGVKKDSNLILTPRVRGGHHPDLNSQLDRIDPENPTRTNKEPPSNPREWLKNAFSLAVYGDNTTASGPFDATKKKKCVSTYSIKALLFSITMLSSYLTNPTSTSSSCTSGDILFMIAFVLFVITNAILLVKLPDYGNALVYISWFLLELVSCLLSNLFNGYIALAILAVPLPTIVVVAIAHPPLEHILEKYVLSFNNNGSQQGNNDAGNGVQHINDPESEHFDHLFDLSQGIANCGGLITAVISDDDNHIVGFFFFLTIALALYLMMVITVRAVSCPHATCLAIVLMVSFLITIIIALTSFVRRSGSQPQLENAASPFEGCQA